MTLRTYQSPFDEWVEVLMQNIAQEIDRDILAELRLNAGWQA
jgi:hypothetical protein